jgi:unsaturated rhamnogalacturonyl hydrolase
MRVALRTSNGGLAHVWEGGKEDFKNQLWIDSVFMAGIFMIRYAIYSSNDVLMKEALEQYNLHTKLLFDSNNDLFYHAYHCLDKKFLGEHWGRGNGWMAASLAELFSLLDTKKYYLSNYLQVFKKFMEKAYSLKENDGMLHTLLLHKDTYVETTATSLFGYAALKGFKLGILDKRFEDWGRQIISTVSGFISDDGKIEYCSYGTDPESKEVYATRQCDQSLYADGIVMLLLSEGMN